jgi:diacylglycerol kinase family enzyme
LRVRAIVNRGGGSADPAVEQRLAELFAAQGIEADISFVAPDELAQAFVEAAKAGGLDAVVAGGGDGTIGTAAAALAGTGRPLGILPLGTLNHFARDAGLPPDLDQAVATIASGETRQVDIAEVNGRVFVNNSAVGLYPEIVRRREAQQRRLGRSKRLAMLVAGLRAFYRFSRRRLTIRIAGMEAPIETPLIFIGNNRYEVAPLSLGRREAIDRGALCVYAPLARGPLHFLGITVRAAFGRTGRQRDFVSLDGVEEIEIDSRKARLTVSVDGEAEAMDTPLRYRIRPRALTLIVSAARS